MTVDWGDGGHRRGDMEKGSGGGSGSQDGEFIACYLTVPVHLISSTGVDIDWALTLTLTLLGLFMIFKTTTKMPFSDFIPVRGGRAGSSLLLSRSLRRQTNGYL